MDNGCLAIIAFSAGAELQLGDVRRIKKQVFFCTEAACMHKANMCCGWSCNLCRYI